jgi:hypothetical protein
MQFLSHISESIWQMGSGNNVTPDISEPLHIGNVKEAYRSTNKVNDIGKMIKHDGKCTCLDCMEKVVSHHALQGWQNIDSANVFNLLSITNKRRNTHRAHHDHVQHCQKELFFHPVSQQVHNLGKTHFRGVCRSIKLATLSDTSEHFGIFNFGQL